MCTGSSMFLQGINLYDIAQYVGSAHFLQFGSTDSMFRWWFSEFFEGYPCDAIFLYC
jgi:hypothetical protein